MRSEKVIFKNNLGHQLVGIIDYPNKSGKVPAVIICHGFKGYKEQQHLKTLAGLLRKNGLLVLRFDFCNGVGESYGHLEDIQFSQELKDLRSAIDYLARRKDVEGGKIILVGHSLGAQLIFHYAPSDYRIKAIIGLAGSYLHGYGGSGLEIEFKKQLVRAKKSGYFNLYSPRKKRFFKIKIDFYYDLIKHDTLQKVKKIKVPALLVHGGADSSVRLDSAKKIYARLKKPKKLVVVPGAPHTWRGHDDPGGVFQKTINKIVVDWLNDNL